MTNRSVLGLRPWWLVCTFQIAGINSTHTGGTASPTAGRCRIHALLLQRRPRVIVSSSIAVWIKISRLSKWRFSIDNVVQSQKDYQAANQLRVEHFFMRHIQDRVRKTRNTSVLGQACSKTTLQPLQCKWRNITRKALNCAAKAVQ